jgi:hypothetical protein
MSRNWVVGHFEMRKWPLLERSSLAYASKDNTEGAWEYTNGGEHGGYAIRSLVGRLL